jgi:hypothetical protein
VTWHDPTWLQLLLLAGAAFRLTHLVGRDDITHSLRAFVTGLTDAEYNEWAEIVWHNQQEDVDPWDGGAYPLQHEDGQVSTVRTDWPVMPMPVGRFRFKLAQLVRCPWCAGFWISVGVTVAWWAAPDATLGIATALTLSTAVALVSKHLDS